MDVEITRIRHRWAEKKGFHLARPHGAGEYILLHFLSGAELTWQGETRRVQNGSLIVFSPEMGHVIDATEPLRHDWMHLRGDVAQMLACFGLVPDVMYQPGYSGAISDIVAALEMEFFAQRSYWPEMAQAKLTEMLILISRSLTGEDYAPAVQDETVERLRETRARMLSGTWTNWTIERMAANANISTSRLHAVYKAVFGISPKHDLILMRIEKAKQLMQEDMSVTEAAETLGYTNVYHFIRQFKQYTGTTPKQYKGD